MKERLKLIRKTLKLSQEEFGNKIGIKSKAHISSLEIGKRSITDRIVSDICREFNVNEEWLRNGIGEMFVEPDTFSLDEYLQKRKVSDIELDIIKAYFDIPADIRSTLVDTFKVSFFKKNTNEDVPKNTDTIDEEVAAYRAELEAEQKGQILSALEEQKENLK